jgi:myosin-1
VFEKPLTPEDAVRARDALAMSLYQNAFRDIVVKLNASMETMGGESSRIGILDIYGFEIFDENSMEQLHINYCNEKLQQLFIELTLKAEQETYTREGIRWETVK